MRKIISITLTILIIVLTSCGAESIDSPFSEVTLGDIIELGGIELRVLDIKDGKALVISDKVLEQRVWHHEQKSLSWDVSDIRQYLNGDFFDNTFAPEERTFIAETRVTTEANPWFATHGGTDTHDRVFLLSVEEVVRYFGDSGEIKNFRGMESPLSDEYNSSRVARNAQTDEAAWWWLRTPGRNINPRVHFSAVAVGGGGEVFIYGIYVIAEQGGVRPAMWIYI